MHPRGGWQLAGVGLGAASSRNLGWGFYWREREDGSLSMSCWGEARLGGPIPGAWLPCYRRRGSPCRQ
jgi:hypothetical protein